MSLAAPARAAEGPVSTRPPEWEVGDWINSQPLALKDLAGKVVLVRWWFGPGCPYCAATAPALNDFHGRYRDRGLVVGLYHHKAKTPLDLDKVKETADKLGFRFPVAVDRDWKTLRAWWLDGHRRGWTSVSFLLDRKGVVRHVHPGGQYVEGDRDHAALKAKIEDLLAEK
jgi:thiol-disulfide isomerase/thioredoxin